MAYLSQFYHVLSKLESDPKEDTDDRVPLNFCLAAEEKIVCIAWFKCTINLFAYN